MSRDPAPLLSRQPASEFEGHGWSVNGKSLHIGGLPGRKQTCLYVEDGSVIRTLAFFKTEAQAKEALDMLDRIAWAPSGWGSAVNGF